MLIDTHIHLQDSKYAIDVESVLHRAATAGVTTIIVPGTNLIDSRQAILLAEMYSQGPCQVYAAVGVHPTETQRLNERNINELRSMAQHERVVAIGEIGLDYYWPTNKNRTWYCAEPITQLHAFESQLQLAADLALPVIIHDREAHEDTLKMLAQWHAADSARCGVLHSYSLGTENLKAVIDLGFFIGIGGPVTYKNAHDLRSVAEIVPASILLLETDGPYLSPEPHRGKRNEPQYVPLIAKKIADLRGIPMRDLEEHTTHNARILFKLK